MPFSPLGLPLEWTSGSLSGARSHSAPVPLWKPSNPRNTPMSRYREHINSDFDQSLGDSHALHRWSVTHPQEFWIDLYGYCGIIPPLPPHTSQAYDPAVKLRDVPEFFPGHRLNYAENVLVPNTSANPDAVALIGIREGKLEDPESVTWAQLSELVKVMRSAMVRRGIKEGDVVAAIMSNSIWIIVVFLASASMGALFTSISPEMGVGGCVSRLKQVRPVWLFADVDYAVRGQRVSLVKKVREVLAALGPDENGNAEKDNVIGSLVKTPQTVWVPTCHAPHLFEKVNETGAFGVSLFSFLTASSANDTMEYTRVALSTPLVILYSSGTTGPPKCLLSPHGSIINYKKIAILHNSLGPHSTVFQYTSTSWVLFNVMNGHLSVGAKLVCYDGGALYPDAGELLRILSKYRATYWGTSPRYLLELEQSRIQPADFDLTSLTMVTTTGATLTGHQMKWFYDAFPRAIHLSSIAGGTDIASSWIASNPAGPVYANEMQMWALGVDGDVADTLSGASIAHTSEAGELICRAPFPSMPSGFWGDTNRKKYRESYFERFEVGRGGFLDVWAQHDFMSRNPVTGGMQIHGRSDGVLNPSGIRFGSAEIYEIVEGPKFNDIIADTLCVGRRRPGDDDEAVFLFVIMAKGQIFSLELVDRIREAIRTALSPRHVPKFVFEVDEIPYTINGKKVEIAVKKVISGLDVKVSSTVSNPGSLKKFEKYAKIEREQRSSRASKL